jgi:23S rRNA (cytidine1920-2'-O)/16S rRNA (cytidine1409-2'-O)-methyltransferase
MRLDQYLVEKHLTESRSKAIQLIKSGDVLINGQPQIKGAYAVKPTDKVELQQSFQYVGRGGYKIGGFLDNLSLIITNKSVLDVGCSVGGFTDYFLQKGARSVVAIDIAKDILDPKLKHDAKVTFFDEVDAQNLDQLKSILKDQQFEIISTDVTNVSAKLFLTNILNFLSIQGHIVLLYKPQYEHELDNFNKKSMNLLTHDFDLWLDTQFQIIHKEWCALRGGTKNRGNQEVFYLLKRKN